MKPLTKLIFDDMKPALGVTEPGAVAFAVATAKSHVQGDVEKVIVTLNSGMYKNAFTCGIPNSDHYGTPYAAALGAVAANSAFGLESLRSITPEDDALAAQMVADGKIEVRLDHIGSAITIDAAVSTKEDSCTVQIRDSHTNITKIVKNGVCIYEKESADTPDQTGATSSADSAPQIHQYSLHDILTYIKTVPAEELTFIRDAFSMNLELLEEGIRSDRAVITNLLFLDNACERISSDAKNTAQFLCNGAIEARVLGLSKPAMSITGSGAHGIIATMPLYAYQQVYPSIVNETTLLRATALSYLITMYIKEYSGRLSAFCGCGIAAGTGMACGLAYMQRADEPQITRVIQNMASGLTGMICDGGNHGCAMKGIVAVDAAFRSVDLAMAGITIGNIHGINGMTPEDTMRNMGRIASPGMEYTEKVIVEIMENKF